MKYLKPTTLFLTAALLFSLTACGRTESDEGSSSQTPAVFSTSHWNGSDGPASEIQTVKLYVTRVSGEISLRIANHPKFAESEVFLNGQSVRCEGAEINVNAGLFLEFNEFYLCEYSIREYSLIGCGFCITPCKQDTAGTYILTVNSLSSGADVTDCQEIRVMPDGILLTQVTGDFMFRVTPVRGGSIPFAYGESLGIKGHADRASNILLSWDDSALIVRSDQDILNLRASDYADSGEDGYTRAEAVKSEYRIVFEKASEYGAYKPIIE